MQNLQSTVLLVEDDRALQELAAMLLEDHGYQVITASNAADALGRIYLNPSLALIITDVNMPGDVNGYGLIKILRERGDETPAILISGAVTLPGPLPSHSRFVTKPYTVPGFYLAVEESITKASK